MSEIRKWLETNGLGQYSDAFEANDIDIDLYRLPPDPGRTAPSIWPDVIYGRHSVILTLSSTPSRIATRMPAVIAGWSQITMRSLRRVHSLFELA